MESSSTSTSPPKLEYCIICCQHVVTSKKDTITTRNTKPADKNHSIFTELCQQLKIKSATRNKKLSWDFEIEELPFCQSCTETATTIKNTQELIDNLQIKINDLIKRVQKKIRKTCEEGTEDVLYGTPNLHLVGQNLRRVKHFRTQVLLNAHVPQVESEAFNSRKTEPEWSQSQEPALTRSRVQKTVEHHGRGSKAINYAEFSDKDEGSDVQKNLRRGYINPEDLEVKVKEEVGEIWEEDFFSNSTPNYYSSGDKGAECLGEYVGSCSDIYNPGDEDWETSDTAFVAEESHSRLESDSDESEEDFKDDTRDPDWSDEEEKIKRLKLEEKQRELEEKMQAKKPPFFTTSEDGNRLIHGEYEVLKIDEKYQCYICKDIPKSMGQIIHHIKYNHKGECFMCSTCGKRFQQNHLLQTHINSEHEGKFVECPICKRPLKNRNYIKRHLWSHKSQQEKDAEVTAGNRAAINLSKKLSKKVESRDHQCGQCGKFLRKRTIKQHEQTHLVGTERPFTCTLCPNTFRTLNDLKIHERGVHTPHLKKFQCQTCLKRFSTRTLLSHHIMTHTGEKPVQCDKCPKSFISKTQLKNHQVTHTQERPFKCKNCSATYAWRGSIDRHKLTCCPKDGNSKSKSRTSNPATENIEIIIPNIVGHVGDVESFFVEANN